MTPRQVIAMIFAIACLLAIRARGAATIEFNGVLGNSGETGGTLVRFGPKARSDEAAGVGVVFDRFGFLWGRGGEGILNRYALDGRLVASRKIPRGGIGAGSCDQITLCGDLLVLKLNETVYTLPITAAPDEAPHKLTPKAMRISFCSHDDWIAAAAESNFFLLSLRSGETRPVATLGYMPQFVEIGPDGATYACVRGILHKYQGDAEITTDGWLRSLHGDRLQFVGGYFFDSSGGGTLRRLNADMDPDPGVVLGGQSGSVIGHLEGNPEIGAARGMALIRDGLFAVGGSGSIVQLIDWQPQKQQFGIIRRIGCASACRGLGLDRQGNIWWFGGYWRWDDTPDAPLLNGVSPHYGKGIGQAAFLDTDVMVAPYSDQGKLGLIHGSVQGDIRSEAIDATGQIPVEPVGAVVFKDEKRRAVLIIDAAGTAHEVFVGPDGKPQHDGGPVQLRAAQPLSAWTTLGMKDADTLLAAADGHIVEFTRTDHDWTEHRRWNSWGNAPLDHFGAEITLAMDGQYLWVSDTQRNRVLVFDAAADNAPPLASFGVVDQDGNDLASLSNPTTLSARASRAVVFDGGNQRFVKLTFHPALK